MADSERSCNWLALPREVTTLILEKVGPFEILNNAQFVCRDWWRICEEEPSLWTRINVADLDLMEYYHQFEDYNQANEKIEALIREAVDRSRGGLVDLNLEQTFTNELFCFVVERCTKIRRLRGAAVCINEEVICQLISQLPFLEELDMVVSRNHPPKTLEFIGRTCPKLTTLKWNSRTSSAWSRPSNKDAHAIAHTMPQLRRLQLIGNRLTNKGVRALLDACPNLESLDLRGAYFVRLKSDIRQRCARWIDHLRGPFEGYDDEDFDVPSYDPNDYTWLQDLGDEVHEVDDDARSFSSYESFDGMQVGGGSDDGSAAGDL